MKRILLFALLATAAAGAAQAQASFSDVDRSRYSAASVYRYAEPGDVPMLVNLWGTVRNPGLYEVPQGSRLSHLLSVAGGPIVGLRDQRSDQTIRVRLFRGEGGRQRLAFESVMENEIITAEEDPILQEGDVLTVETEVKQRFSWRDVFPIVSAVTSIGVALAYLTN